MPPAMLHKAAGEIHEKVFVHEFLDKQVWERLPGWSEVQCEGALAFSPMGRFLAAGLHGGRVGIWDLDTMPHLTLTIGLPAKLRPPEPDAEAKGADEGQTVGNGQKEAVELEVVGLCWSTDATRLLVTLQQEHDQQGCHFCLWDVVTREELCYLRWPSSCGLPKLLPLEERKCVLCTGPSDLTFLDLQTGQATVAEQAGEPEATALKSKQPGACVLAEGGKVVYCTIGRRIFKFDCAGRREISRSPGLFGHFAATVDGLFLSPDEKYLLACTSRGSHLFELATLTHLIPLGGQGVQVDWSDWTFGHNNTIIGIPTPVTYHSKQEHLFVWKVQGHTATGPDIKLVPKEGLSAICISPTRPMIVGISQRGALWMHRETFSTSFPGAMYPKGYVVLENNVVYQEKEDELDKFVKRVGRGSETARRKEEEEEEEAAAAAVARAKEAEELEKTVVDIVTVVEEEEAATEPQYRVRYGWDGEEHVHLMVEIKPLVDEAGEKGAADEEDDEEDRGGIPGLFPMPRASKRIDRMPPRKGDAASAAGRRVIRLALEKVVKKGMGRSRPQEAQSSASSVVSAPTEASQGASDSQQQPAPREEDQQQQQQQQASKKAKVAASSEEQPPPPPPQEGGATSDAPADQDGQATSEAAGSNSRQEERDEVQSMEVDEPSV